MKLVDNTKLDEVQIMLIAFKGMILIVSGLGTVFYGLLQINQEPISYWIAAVISSGGIGCMLFGVLDLVRPRLFTKENMEAKN